MFESLVITLREGVEAALIVGIVLAYLAKIGRRRANRMVYAGLVAALLASLLAAYFIRRLELAEEAYEGWLMLGGGVLVASMVVWMWRTGKRLKREIESRLSQISSEWSRSAEAGLLLFVFLMVLREGIETVLFLAAVSLRSSDFANLIGGLMGLALAVGLAVAFFKGSIRVDLRKFFTVTSLVLLVISAQLLITGIHELSEGGILPASRREMALVGPIVNNEAFFFVAIVALCVFLLAVERFRSEEAGGAALETLSGPARRKAMAERRQSLIWKTAASALGFVIILLISAEFVYSRQAQAVSPGERVAAAKGVVKIPTAPLVDHRLHRYVVSENGVDVRLIVLLDDSDTVRAALDACSICGSQGYYQDGRNVICRNCGAAIYTPTIGLAGGCNPVHVNYVVEGDSLTVAESDLLSAESLFKN